MVSEPQDRLQQALKLIHYGRREEARILLAKVLLADPNREEAWLAMSLCVDDPEQQRECLERAQRIQRAKNGQTLKIPSAEKPSAVKKPAPPPYQPEPDFPAAAVQPEPNSGNAAVSFPRDANLHLETGQPQKETPLQQRKVSAAARAAASRPTRPIDRERRRTPAWLSMLAIILLLALLVAFAVVASSVIADLSIDFGIPTSS